MAKRRRGDGPDDRPQLRLVSSTGPDSTSPDEPDPDLPAAGLSAEHPTGEHPTGEHLSAEHLSSEHLSSEHVSAADLLVADLLAGKLSVTDLPAEDLEDDVLELILDDNSSVDLEFLLVPLLTESERQMRSIRRPLDAEMWASELLGMLELGAPADSTAQEREAVTLNLATRLAEHAIEQHSPSGLAVLRTLSTIGPQESRALAKDAADRTAESGIRDRTWVAALGHPEVRRCWRFRDPDGAQESVTVVFRYGRREHALTVLIDHELGGGVKDCWVSEDPAGVLAESTVATAAEGIEIEFLPTEQGGEILRSALARPECPGEPDEIEDVALGRALLQARVELL